MADFKEVKIPGVCKETAKGLREVIHYRGLPQPRLITTWLVQSYSLWQKHVDRHTATAIDLIASRKYDREDRIEEANLRMLRAADEVIFMEERFDDTVRGQIKEEEGSYDRGCEARHAVEL